MRYSLRHGCLVLAQIAAACLLSTAAVAQQPRGSLPAPPPMRLVSRAEHSELAAATNAKTRLHAAITLAEQHLSQAEMFTNQKKFDEASAELGNYLGLIGDLRDFLMSLNADKGSTRDLFRHMEIAVRGHIPRLAVMRRTTPADYAIHIKDAEDYIKDTRSVALDSFYGHSVLRDEPADKTSGAEPQAESRGLKRP